MSNDGWTVVTNKKKERKNRNRNNSSSYNSTSDWNDNDNVYNQSRTQFQDWNPVTIRGKSKPTSNGPNTNNVVKKHSVSNTNRFNFPDSANKIEKKAEEGDFTIKKINHELSEKIKQSRQNKKMTQKELAKLCNIQASEVQSYERGDAVPNGAILSKMSKVLGVTLSNKKKN